MSPGKTSLAAVLIGLCASAMADDSAVTVGSTSYPTSIAVQSGDKPMRLKLTGAVMRTKWTFNVYSTASYVQEGTVVRTPESLASAAVPKKLCLTFERAVGSADLAKSFREAVAMNHPAPAFGRAGRAGRLLRRASGRQGEQHLAQLRAPRRIPVPTPRCPGRDHPERRLRAGGLGSLPRPEEPGLRHQDRPHLPPLRRPRPSPTRSFGPGPRQAQ